MVVLETEVIGSQGEIDSPLRTDHQPEHIAGGSSEPHPFSSLGRQSSIYSLTLDEFQHALCESGKNFGLMNMDEFLTSIWNAEENQQAAMNTSSHVAAVASTSYNNNAPASHGNSNGIAVPPLEASNPKGGIVKQQSLPRQGSLTIPAPLCRKTVDEVWSEIHRGRAGTSSGGDNCSNDNNTHDEQNAARQPTFGEMTLEDFLVKAGVVREQQGSALSPVVQPQQQHFSAYQSNNNTNVGPGFVTRPVMPAGSVAVMTPSVGGGVIGDTSGYANGNKRSGGYNNPPQPIAACYGGRVRNGGAGGYGSVQPVGMVGPVSPVSPDGISHGQVDSMGQFGMDLSGLRGRKRIMDGPVEKVVERRQRRMIKNRESAARSRARKQAYTVELEAELNQLKEENAQLKHALAELERKRKQQSFEEPKMREQTKAYRAREKLGLMRRNRSCPI